MIKQFAFVKDKNFKSEAYFLYNNGNNGYSENCKKCGEVNPKYYKSYTNSVFSYILDCPNCKGMIVVSLRKPKEVL